MHCTSKISKFSDQKRDLILELHFCLVEKPIQYIKLVNYSFNSFRCAGQIVSNCIRKSVCV